jgi:mitogen-activated protein kinase kinase kinase
LQGTNKPRVLSHEDATACKVLLAIESVSTKTMVPLLRIPPCSSSTQMKEVARGAFAVVLTASDTWTPETVAIKRFRKNRHGDEANREAAYLSRLSHANVVTYLWRREHGSFIDIGLEYCLHGSVESILRDTGLKERLDNAFCGAPTTKPDSVARCAKSHLPELLIVDFLHQVLEGLSYIHCEDIVHCDIKAANILVQAGGICKIADFNQAWSSGSPLTHGRTPIRGSAQWMAPEVKSQTAIGTSADIWSLGCFTIEMLTGTLPRPECTSQEQALFKRDPPSVPGFAGQRLKEIILSTLTVVPQERPSAQELLRRTYLDPSDALWKLK